jgi:hypothetical protein
MRSLKASELSTNRHRDRPHVAYEPQATPPVLLGPVIVEVLPRNYPQCQSSSLAGGFPAPLIIASIICALTISLLSPIPIAI